MNLPDLSYTIVQSNLINPLAYSLFPDNSKVDYSGNYYVGPSISFEIIQENSSIQNYLKTLRSNTADLNININKYQPSDLSLPPPNNAGFTVNPHIPNNFIEFSFNDLSLSYTSSILHNSFANSCNIKIRPCTVGNNLDSPFDIKGANTSASPPGPFRDLCLNSIKPETWSYIGIFNNLWMGGLFSGDPTFNDISCMANIIFDSIFTPNQVSQPPGQPDSKNLWLVNNKLTSSNKNFFYQFFLGKSALEYLNRWVNYSFEQGVNDLSININSDPSGHEYNLFIKPKAGFRIDPSFIPCLPSDICGKFFDYTLTNGPYYINNANIKISPHRNFTCFINSYNLLSYSDISNLDLQSDICLNYGTLKLNMIDNDLSSSLHSYLGKDSNFYSDITKIKFLLRDISDSNFNIKKFSKPKPFSSDLSAIFPINLYEFSGTSLYIQSSLFYTPSDTISGDDLSYQLINNGFDMHTTYNQDYINNYYQYITISFDQITIDYSDNNLYANLSFTNTNNFFQNYLNTHNLLGKEIIRYNTSLPLPEPTKPKNNQFYSDFSFSEASSIYPPPLPPVHTSLWLRIFRFYKSIEIDFSNNIFLIRINLTHKITGQGNLASYKNFQLRITKYLLNWELLGNPSNLMGDTNNCLFGTSMALNTNGDLLAVGAPAINDASTAYCKVFQYNNNDHMWDPCGHKISYNTISFYDPQQGPITNFCQSVGIGYEWLDRVYHYFNTILLPYYKPTHNNGSIAASIWPFYSVDIIHAFHDPTFVDPSFGKIVAFGSVNRIFVYTQPSTTNNPPYINFQQARAATDSSGYIEGDEAAFGGIPPTVNCLAINSKGPPYKLAIGDSSSSKFYVFDLSYDQSTKLINGAPIYDCSFCDPSYNFPTSLSFNASGTILAVGATAKTGDICGCIQVFRFDSSNQSQRIGKIDNPSSQFGKSIAINNNATYDNNIVVVGAPGDILQNLYERIVPIDRNSTKDIIVKDYIDLSNGDCFVYKYDPLNSDGSYSIYGSNIVFETKNDVKTFGYSVAINDDGDRIAVGAPWSSNFIKGLQSTGSVYTFKLNKSNLVIQ